VLSTEKMYRGMENLKMNKPPSLFNSFITSTLCTYSWVGARDQTLLYIGQRQ